MVREKDNNESIQQWAHRSGSNERVKAMLNLAHPDLAVLQSELDVDPWLFNCLNGTIELKSGVLSAHRRKDMITKLASVNYDPDATAPNWHRFNSEIFGANKAIMSYVQRFCGYSLTGDVSEQSLAFCHGAGANGKTTFINAFRQCLGDYAQEAAPGLLLEKTFAGIPNDIARLRGARFVTVTETAANRAVDEGFIKRSTGGDRVAARFLHGEYFEFPPTHKLWLISNHKPIIRGQDYAIWRRIKLVPFEVTFKPADQDRDLPNKLRDELPGILAWAVRGCLEWQRIGLREPAEVQMATDIYKTEMDTVQRFLDECCLVANSGGMTQAKDLYEKYKSWAEQNGERPLSGQDFGKQLPSKGLERKRMSNGIYWLGLSLVE